MAADDPKEQEYEGYRQAAREITQEDYTDRAAAGGFPMDIAHGLSLTAIDDLALKHIEDYWPATVLPWVRICGQARPFIKRFEVAMWVGEDLEGVCSGRASRRDDNVTLRFLERKPGSSVLKGHAARIARDTAENYARVIGRRRLRLRDPVREAIPRYEALGFRLERKGRGGVFYERVLP